MCFGAYGIGENNKVAAINNDGSAEFAGGQAVINDSGVLDIQSGVAAADDSTLLRCGSANVTGGANAFVVKADGSASFAGDIDVNALRSQTSVAEGVPLNVIRNSSSATDTPCNI